MANAEAEKALQRMKRRPPSSRGRLEGGWRRWLPNHLGVDGRLYRRFLNAGVELVGGSLDGSDVMMLEVERYARAGVMADQAQRYWAELMHRRSRRGFGKGPVPTVRQVEQAARRSGLNELTFKSATDRLEVLAARRERRGVAHQVQRARA